MIIVMQIITVLVNIYISFTENTKRLYIAIFLLNFAQLIMYWFNSDLTTTLIYIMITVRSILCIYKSKFKTDLIPYSIINIQLIIGYFTIKETLQIIPVIMACYATWYLWFYTDTQKIRIGNIIANTTWAFYNAYTGLYIAIIMRAMAVASNVIAYVKRKQELLRETVKI